MAEYIKREDAVFAACKVLDKFGGCKMGALCPDVGCSEVRDIVDQYICADVRPVVLCRDCIHFQQFRTWDGFCKIDGMLWNNDFFCANGKKEES